jgi:predicted RNase H-like nuclease (RuvC/YqgF family)
MMGITVSKPSDEKILLSVRDKFVPENQAYYKASLTEISRKLVHLETENAELKNAVEELMDELSRLQSVVGEEDYAIIEQKLKDAEGLL